MCMMDIMHRCRAFVLRTVIIILSDYIIPSAYVVLMLLHCRRALEHLLQSNSEYIYMAVLGRK